MLSGLIDDREQALGLIVGAYTPDGHLWVGWTNASPGVEYAKLGDARGVGGTVVQLPTPSGVSAPQSTDAVTSGGRLVLVSSWTTGGSAGSMWATVVNRP